MHQHLAIRLKDVAYGEDAEHNNWHNIIHDLYSTYQKVRPILDREPGSLVPDPDAGGGDGGDGGDGSETARVPLALEVPTLRAMQLLLGLSQYRWKIAQ